MAGSRFVNPVPQFIDINGEPILGGAAGLYFYETGTLTLKPTYTTSDLSIANPQPVPTNSVGAPDREIWLDGDYRAQFKDAAGTIVWDRDPITAPMSASVGGTQVATYADLIAFTTAGPNQAVELLGYYTRGDGGGGQFYWDATSTDDADGGSIIQATGVSTGRFIRLFDDPYSISVI